MKIKSLNEIASVRDYLKRIGAEVRSFKSAVVTEKTGQYNKDVSVIRFKEDGTVFAIKDQYKPTDVEQLLIKSDFKNVELPQLKKLPSLYNLPEDLKKADPENLFEFRDTENQIVMIQERWIGKDGTKGYTNWTYWDTEEWYKLDPEGYLPIWGMENLKNHTVVFLHEGAKAARKIQRMIDSKTEEHPWKNELSGAVHLGWCGGAPSPHRTNFAQLTKLGVKVVYIVSDNDKLGVEAVPIISQALNLTTFQLQFTNEWPSAFDLGDEFPKHMFGMIEGKLRYTGPPFISCVHPATWATDCEEGPDGETIITMRDSFKDMWAYVEEADIYVCKALPGILRGEKILDNMIASFSHTSQIHELILKAYSGRSTSLCYRPDKIGMIITNGVSSSINLHTPSTIKEEPGDPKPFLDYLEYMFPNPEERKEVERWCATLIARPDIRMEYALLLISEATGIGKTTLGARVLKPLVGETNTSAAREQDIVDSAFNDWVANKRLVIVNEIYSGHSWKAYHALKSIITDKDIMVNQKYMRQYQVDNWAHIFACSNSMRALKLEEDDRRWFYPEVNEDRWPREKFGKFLDWLDSGGLGIIKSWAKGYNDYVLPGQRAPMTQRKKEMIEGSRSDGQVEAAVIAEALMKIEKPACLAMKDIVFFIRAGVQGKVFDSDYELRKTMLDVGAHVIGKRVSVQGRTQYIICNTKLLTLIQKNEEATEKLVADNLMKVSELIEMNM